MGRWEAYYQVQDAHKRELAERIKSALQLEGWTQTKLCKATGINKTTLYLLFHGKIIPNLSTITKIETALDISLIEILPLAETRVPIMRVQWFTDPRKSPLPKHQTLDLFKPES